MEQTTLSQNGNSLLGFAISRLSPEIFSHPVWVRFGKKQISDSLSLIVDLSSAVKGLQATDPGTACQVLLLCAVYQNYAGQHYQALKITQQAVSLAEQSKLARELVWAMWGACAISVQQGNYEEAARHLIDLQAVLSTQDEWILANFIDVLRQSFPTATAAKRSPSSHVPYGQAFEDMLTFTLDWCQHWGFPPEDSEPTFEALPLKPSASNTTVIQSFFLFQRLQGSWHTLMLAIRGELRLQWIRNERPKAAQSFSLWDAILGALGSHRHHRNLDSKPAESTSQTISVPLLPVTEDSPQPSPRKPKPKTRKSKGDVKYRSKKGASLTPVTVQMLGPFSMTVGDLAVSLPPSRGLAVLKYLLLHHKQSIPREVLMDLFWPEAEPELARNNLNVAMHNLRKALFGVTELPMIIFANGLYSLPSDLKVWLDVEEFERCVKVGQRLESRNQLTAAITEYETAVSLYQGDFLEQNLYDEWTVLDRERLRIAYLDTLDRLSQIYFSQERYAACITVCQLILAYDHCHEEMHCLLMRCYSRQGQYHLARRQYQICVDALKVELEVDPSPETKQLYEQIRKREHV